MELVAGIEAVAKCEEEKTCLYITTESFLRVDFGCLRIGNVTVIVRARQ